MNRGVHPAPTLERRLVVVCLGIVPVFSGCAEDHEDRPFDRLAYSDASEEPGHVDLAPKRITIQQGIAVDVRVSALDDHDDPLPLLELESEEPQVFDLAPAKRPGRFVMYGVLEGETRLRVLSRDREKGFIPVTVLPPQLAD